MKNFQIIIIVALLILPVFVFADEAGDGDFVYLFHLYYDNGQLFANRDLQFKYDVLPEVFVQESFNTQFPYKGEIINLKGEVAKSFQFDPRQGNPQFLKGTLSVKAPYVPDGQKANFYDAQGNQLLSVFVSESSFCNDDGVCNPDVGEDTKTCPNDCRATVVTPPVEPNLGQGGMIKILIYLIIGLGIVAGGWFGWKWWKGRQDSRTLQPTSPLPSDNSRNTTIQ